MNPCLFCTLSHIWTVRWRIWWEGNKKSKFISNWQTTVSCIFCREWKRVNLQKSGQALDVKMLCLLLKILLLVFPLPYSEWVVKECWYRSSAVLICLAESTSLTRLNRVCLSFISTSVPLLQNQCQTAHTRGNMQNTCVASRRTLPNAPFPDFL